MEWDEWNKFELHVRDLSIQYDDYITIWASQTKSMLHINCGISSFRMKSIGGIEHVSTSHPNSNYFIRLKEGADWYSVVAQIAVTCKKHGNKKGNGTLYAHDFEIPINEDVKWSIIIFALAVIMFFIYLIVG